MLTKTLSNTFLTFAGQTSLAGFGVSSRRQFRCPPIWWRSWSVSLISASLILSRTMWCLEYGLAKKLLIRYSYILCISCSWVPLVQNQYDLSIYANIMSIDYWIVVKWPFAWFKRSFSTITSVIFLNVTMDFTPWKKYKKLPAFREQCLDCLLV